MCIETYALEVRIVEPEETAGQRILLPWYAVRESVDGNDVITEFKECAVLEAVTR
jgi:hypothetical protein